MPLEAFNENEEDISEVRNFVSSNSRDKLIGTRQRPSRLHLCSAQSLPTSKPPRPPRSRKIRFESDEIMSGDKQIKSKRPPLPRVKPRVKPIDKPIVSSRTRSGSEDLQRFAPIATNALINSSTFVKRTELITPPSVPDFPGSISSPHIHPFYGFGYSSEPNLSRVDHNMSPAYFTLLHPQGLKPVSSKTVIYRYRTESSSSSSSNSSTTDDYHTVSSGSDTASTDYDFTTTTSTPTTTPSTPRGGSSVYSSKPVYKPSISSGYRSRGDSSVSIREENEVIEIEARSLISEDIADSDDSLEMSINVEAHNYTTPYHISTDSIQRSRYRLDQIRAEKITIQDSHIPCLGCLGCHMHTKCSFVPILMFMFLILIIAFIVLLDFLPKLGNKPDPTYSSEEEEDFRYH